jgi:hypothetical protein
MEVFWALVDFGWVVLVSFTVGHYWFEPRD